MSTRRSSIAGVRVAVADSREVAERLVALEIAELLARKPAAVIGLATGSSVLGVYRELIALHRRGQLDSSRAMVFNLDEYLGLTDTHPAAFARWLHENFLRDVGVDPTRVHLMPGGIAAADAPRQARAYEERIARAGGLDFQLLGLGRNGHIGFNEPGSAVDSRTRVVDLHPTTIADATPTFGSPERVPTSAITIGVATILEARSIRMVAFGAHKSTVVRRMLHDPIDPRTPATYLRGHPDVELWLDPAAASELAIAEAACDSRSA